MYTKSLFTAAAAASLLGSVQAVPFEMSSGGALNARVVAPTPNNRVLTPEIDSNSRQAPNPKLQDEETMKWSHGRTQATVKTLVNGKTQKMIHSGRMGDWIKSIDCPANSPLVLHMKDSNALDETEKAWSWMKTNKKNSMIFVVDHHSCGGVNGRQPYEVHSVAFNGKTNTAKLAAKPVDWEDFATDAKININNKKVPTVSDLGGDGSFSVAKDFSQPIFSQNVNGVDLSLECSECKTTGSLDYDFDISLSDGISGSLKTADSFGASIGVGLKASGDLTDEFDKGIEFAKIPLEGFSIPGIGQVGPEITFGGEAKISSVSAEAEVMMGVAMTIPDGTEFDLGGDGIDFDPDFSPIGPKASGQVSVSGSVGPIITLDLSASVFSKGITAGVALSAPSLDITVTGSASTDGGQCTDDGVAGVTVDVGVGVEISVFGGFGDPEDQPNEVSLFQKDFPVINECVGISSNGSVSTSKRFHKF